MKTGKGWAYKIMDLRCDRCAQVVFELFVSKDLSAPNVKIVGVPFYCRKCMHETRQPLEETARILDCARPRDF